MTFIGLPDRRYKCIVVDPPWAYGDALPGPTRRGAAKNYDVLPVRVLYTLPVPDLAEPDAHLWLWVTNSFLAEGIGLIRQWGFDQKTMLTWVKVPGIGMGRYLRNTTEHVLFATRGRLPAEGPKNVPSHVIARREAHSVKPEAVYDVIRTISPGPRLDMFARQRREGFDAWGNELPCEDNLTPL